MVTVEQFCMYPSATNKEKFWYALLPTPIFASFLVLKQFHSWYVDKPRAQSITKRNIKFKETQECINDAGFSKGCSALHMPQSNAKTFCTNHNNFEKANNVKDMEGLLQILVGTQLLFHFNLEASLIPVCPSAKAAPFCTFGTFLGAYRIPQKWWVRWLFPCLPLACIPWI